MRNENPSRPPDIQNIFRDCEMQKSRDTVEKDLDIHIAGRRLDAAFSWRYERSRLRPPMFFSRIRAASDSNIPIRVGAPPSRVVRSHTVKRHQAAALQSFADIATLPSSPASRRSFGVRQLDAALP